MTDKTILIVEDDKDAVEMYEMFFRRAEFEIIGICDNGEDAIKVILEKKPKTVLLDIGLKGNLNGMDVLRRIKSGLSASRVVVVSAYPEHEEASKQLGAVVFVKKPVLAEPLVKAFEDVV